MKRWKKKLRIVLAAVMLINTFTVPSLAAEGAVITVESKTALAGSEVEVNVSIANNPGILGATLTLNYDPGLILKSAESGQAFSALTMTPPGAFSSPCNFVWDAQSLKTGDIKDGVILKLIFEVDNDAQLNKDLKVSMSCAQSGVIDEAVNPVIVSFVDGYVTPLAFMYGDLNSDQTVNVADVVLLRRQIAGGYDIEINESAADVNLDEELTVADVVIIRRYLAGGYGIDALPLGTVVTHVHTMESTAYKAATCTEAGNIAFWHCTDCNKYYKDERGVLEVKLEDTVIPAEGHHIVVIPGKAATTSEEGLTDGKKCDKCEYWEVHQEIIPKPESGIGVQYLLGNTPDRDPYLATQTIINENPYSYLLSEGLTLKDITNPIPGYTFLGWFDGWGGNATQIKKINPGETITQLYAHWEIKKYNVNYVCGDNMNPQSGDDYLSEKYAHYSVNTGLTLPKIGISKYHFVGWTDENGNIVTSIPVGTTGDKTFTANWTSYRNQAKSIKKLGTPKVIEDPDSGIILFAYEIGQLEHVPLYTYFKLNNANGLISGYSEKISVQFKSEEANTVTKALSLATTNSNTWSLSEDWNAVTSIDSNSATSRGIEVDDAEKFSKTNTNGYSLTSATGGSSAVTNSSSYTSTLSGSESHNTSSESQIDKAYQHNVGFEEGNNQSVSAGLKIGYGALSAEMSATASHSTKETESTSSSINLRDYASQTDNFSNAYSSSSSESSVMQNSSTWNSAEGYSNSEAISTETSISKTLSEVIATEDHYGESIAKGGSNSSQREQSDVQQSEDTFANSFVYGKVETREIERSYSSTGQAVGDYRLVEAGTVHVYGVVAYDVATATYSMFSYNVLDDKTEEYLDYSTDGSFSDYEYGALPFEVPYEVFLYVNGKTLKSYSKETGKGLQINDQGIVTEYNGNDEYVLIPTYDRQWNETAQEYEAVPVVGMEEEAFKNNKSLKGVYLSAYMDIIPNNAFSGCDNLTEIVCPHLKSIGANAFAGTNLSKFTVADEVEHIGTNAFNGVDTVVINAASKEVAMAAVQSGAKKITVNLASVNTDEEIEREFKLIVPNTVECVTINGAGKNEVGMIVSKEFNDITIISDAKTTKIGNIIINQDVNVPIKISSEELSFEKVSINSAGYAMLISNDTKLTIRGTNNIVSASGNAVVCRSLVTTAASTDTLNISGNVYYCGDNPSHNRIKLTNGNFLSLSKDEFLNYIKGTINVSFNANGGAIEAGKESMKAICGMPLGELPIPTRQHYSFDGWYTQLNGGEKITADYIVTAAVDIPLYAHWNANEYTVTWNTGIGYTITVNRTSSPNKGAATGTLSNGAAIYYGDVLSITYTKADYYHIASSGKTSITVSGNVTSSDIYATAELNSLSDWVPEAQMPAGAEAVNSKWTFTVETTKSVDSVKKSSWSLTNTTSKWSDYGSWSEWSTSKPTASDSRKVEEKTVTDKEAYTNYRYWIYRTSDGWGFGTKNYNTGTAHGSCTQYDEINISYELSVYDYSLGLYGPYNSSMFSHAGDSYWFFGESSYVEAQTHQEYRYSDRSLIYTYSFSSTADPSGTSGVSNVVKYVKYRDK